MATTVNVIRKLERAGATVTKAAGNTYTAQMRAARIEVIDQNGEAINFYVIRHGAQDNLVEDYFAGSFRQNVKQAIELAQRMETW
jgi:hypothetical protein